LKKQIKEEKEKFNHIILEKNELIKQHIKDTDSRKIIISKLILRNKRKRIFSDFNPMRWKR
jgi:hypothetical protein